MSNALKTRESNIELLRIISIFLIMVVHANYLAFGTPTPPEVRANPVGMSFSIVIENIAIICVNVFVLISGWFGIRPKFKSLGAFWFQCVFFYFFIYSLILILGRAKFSIGDFIYCSTVHGFAARYIIMYLFTPIINTWLEKCSLQNVRLFLIAFYGISFLLGWTGIIDEFNYGNSSLSFIGLYILGRYSRLYGTLKTWQIGKLVLSYAAIILFESFLVVILCLLPECDRYSNVIINVSTAYISPNVILKSLLLLLIFSKLKIKSSFINYISISSFASVLLHGNRFVFNYYLDLFPALSDRYTNLHFVTISIGIMLAIFIVAVFIDKIRIFFWTKIYNFFELKFSKISNNNDINHSPSL